MKSSKRAAGRHPKDTSGREKSAPTSEGQRLLRLVPLSLRELGLRIGASKAVVGDWTAGKKLPGQDFRSRLEAEFAIPRPAWDARPLHVADVPADQPQVAVTTAPTSTVGHTLGEVNTLIERVKADLANPKTTSTERVKYTTELTKLLQTRSRIEKDGALLEDRIVLDHPAWRRIRSALALALRPYPDAALAVAQALEGFE